MVRELDEKGFVFLDDAGKPFWCTMYHGKPRLMYWHVEGHWVTWKFVTQADIFSFPHNLTEEQQQVYHDQHNRWTKENQSEPYYVE
jgi:hypothetical protein